eukprot:TRINITY_DN4506_c0_g1_i1.p1 TRINITY_DN4506_c0_g1~~TRINITY_DN4506_c0_g1_i1.p1  ORF type:complete len:211 (-),score=27.66 TRINITY_DN4506_c0_g1_i1:7-639(-)
MAEKCEIAAVVKEKKKAGKCMYLVRWKDRPETDDTWEYAADVRKHFPGVVAEYTRSSSSSAPTQATPSQVGRQTRKGVGVKPAAKSACKRRRSPSPVLAASTSAPTNGTTADTVTTQVSSSASSASSVASSPAKRLKQERSSPQAQHQSDTVKVTGLREQSATGFNVYMRCTGADGHTEEIHLPISEARVKYPQQLLDYLLSKVVYRSAP